MGRNEKLSNIFLAGVVGLVVVSVWSLYQAYQTSQYSPTFASALATLTLVVITSWYAWSTRRLLHVSQAHVKTTRASFAPQIDARFCSWGPDHFEVDVVNRGQGVATDIQIEMRVYTTPLGDISSGDRYRSITHVSASLPPHSSLGGPPGDAVLISPKFFTEVSDKTLNQAVDDPNSQARLADISKDVLGYLSKYLSDARSKPIFPTKTGDVDALVQKLRDSSEVKYPVVEIWVKYHDTLGESRAYEDRIYKARLDLETDKFEEAITNMPSVIATRGLRRKFGDYFVARGRELMPTPANSWDVTPPFEFTISPKVVRADDPM